MVAGQAVTLSGTISTRRSGETVTIFHAPHGQTSLIQLAVVLTGTGGTFSFNTAPSILTSYEARWGSAMSAQVAVQVKPKVTFLPRGRRFYTRSTMTYKEPGTGRTRAPDTYLRTPPC